MGVRGPNTRGPNPWIPPETVADDQDPDLIMDFTEWFESHLLKGRSLHTMSSQLGCSVVTLHRLVYKNPQLCEIRNKVIKNWPSMLRDKGIEMALAGHPTMLIYFSKTIGGLGDGAQRADDDPAHLEQRIPAVTRAQAAAIVNNLRVKQAKEAEALRTLEDKSEKPDVSDVIDVY